MTTMRLFTFITDREGGTYVEQIWAVDIERALAAFYGKYKILVNRDNDPVLIRGLQNVWCETANDANDVLWIMHIVETVFPNEV